MQKGNFLMQISFGQNRAIFNAGIVGVGLAVAHRIIRVFIPSFSVLYDGSDQASWISIVIVCEFLIHLLYFGALISITGRSIPALSRPGYSEERVQGVFDTSSGADEQVNWTRILIAWGFAPVYVLAWLFAYGYL